MADVTQRSLALLAELQTGRAFTGVELAARLQVSPRTLRRDVDRLRGYGYPVQTQPGPGGYYRLAAGRAMPPLVLEDDEAVATLLGLAILGSAGSSGSSAAASVGDAATRAYGKVDQYLPTRLRPRAAALRASVEASPTLGPGASAETVGELAAAIHGREVVTFTYQTADRRAEPYRLIHRDLRWYLLAWDTDRDDWRVFRADRITALHRRQATFVPRPLPAESGVDYLRQGFNKHLERVVLTVDAPVAAVADAFRHHEVELTPVAGGATRAVVMLDSWQWLVSSLAFLDADFTVDEPEAIRETCRRFGDRLRR
jgi:predicted DNA-binding transcriptional regulator YafY